MKPKKFNYLDITKDSKLIKLKRASYSEVKILYANEDIGIFNICRKKNIKNLLEVDYFFLNEEHRKKGIGSSLMRLLCRYASREGYHIILFPSRIDKTPKTRLINFYSKFGFKKHNENMIRYSRKAGTLTII